MVETDWRELLSFSQKDLKQADKEKLCECLSWMEADDIELNFTDLKTLFRLAQDILKFKSEQVNNLHGQLETQRKGGKGKVKTYVASPTRSNDSVLDTIADQEEVIKANKEILEQLYADIAELEGKKNKLGQKHEEDDTESSRDALSEMNAVAQLENELTLKNRHIRKLLSDVKVLDDDNNKLKDKLSLLNDKLTEATQLIENLTDQIFTMNNENTKLKENLGHSKHTKAQLSIELESLKKELIESETNKETFLADIKAKALHWKSLARSKRSEIETLLNENTKLKEQLIQTPKSSSPQRKLRVNDHTIKELQDKLSEASVELVQSAKLIERLKSENQRLKETTEDTADYSTTDVKNESDEGKERIIINKLKKKVNTLTEALSESEDMLTKREQEMAKISSQLKLLEKDKGIGTIIDNLKQKKQQLKSKTEEIKSLVVDVNQLNQIVDNLQLENETMRQKLNIPSSEIIDTKGIMKKKHQTDKENLLLTKELSSIENKLVSVELDNRHLLSKVKKLTELLEELGYQNHSDENIPMDGGGESSWFISRKNKEEQKKHDERDAEMRAITEENEGLRKGLQEILNFLKDNNTTSSGVLALQCPSLEAVLQSMEARHAAGWFAPHMAAVMELKAALGGRDALLTALHEARKETFHVMEKLTIESKKSTELEQKLNEIESKTATEGKNNKSGNLNTDFNIGEFGSWVSDRDHERIDFNVKNDMENYVAKRDSCYEDQLKRGLAYFHGKLEVLFEKMTSLTIQATDDKNNWRIEKEQYKAQIENLRAQIDVDESISENSPGLVTIPNIAVLQRKCSYLEESYSYIRTLNENIQNEHLDCQRDAMLTASRYESKINKLILTMADLTDKLRNSVTIDLFWQQNNAYLDILAKYRNVLNNKLKEQIEPFNFMKRLEDNKLEVIDSVKKYLNATQVPKDPCYFNSVEDSVLQRQLNEVCNALNEKDKQIEQLKINIMELQQSQARFIDENLSCMTKTEVESINKQLHKISEENKLLKEQNQHVSKQLDIALLQLQGAEHKQLDNDMEINLLRHQVLDLQSAGDNKAIVGRLSGEVLVAHLQASETLKKMERQNLILNKERQLRLEAEEMLQARQNIFDIYAVRYETKFRYMYEVMQALRQQYHGCIPLTSIENYTNCLEDLSRKTYSVNAKLNEIEDLQESLIMKHAVFEQVLDISKNKCLEDDDACQHKLKLIVMQNEHARESIYWNKKNQALEKSREEIMKHCNYLEKVLLLVNQGLEKSNIEDMLGFKKLNKNMQATVIEVEDLVSEDESVSRRSQTITLPHPKVLKSTPAISDKKSTKDHKSIDSLPGTLEAHPEKALKTVNVLVQTIETQKEKIYKLVQTDADTEIIRLNKLVEKLTKDNEETKNDIVDAVNLAKQRKKDIMHSNSEKTSLETKLKDLQNSHDQKDKLIFDLNSSLDELKRQLVSKNIKNIESDDIRDAAQQEIKTMVLSLKKIENDKNTIVDEYQKLIISEREEYSKSIKELNSKVLELQTQLERQGSDSDANCSERVQEVATQYSHKIIELEEECFSLQSKLDGNKAELTSYRSEVDRWKNLASERLTKMEQLSSQLEERHSHEVELYKAENQHWLSQLSENQREHLELRSKLSEQRALHVKLAADKDMQIEQLRSVIHTLKSQIMNMQTIMAVNDPSFDLSAIVEVEEASDGISQQGSERLELKFDTALDLQDQDDMRMPASSTTIWQEPVIERLRREKQMVGKQNGMLRRQIKALAARERRARLDAHNLRNQVFRISTSGSKVATAETAALHNKIASLQAQLSSARRDTHSTVALWDKSKRAQQSSDRWQARYEEKCQDVRKLEASLNLTKSALSRLEKEKTVLLSRLHEAKHESRVLIEKQDGEHSEKILRELESERYESSPPVSSRALLDRVQAQQRRIAALEVAEMGNEVLVSEYEKCLAENTVLKGQVLKLESSLLESQIRSPLKISPDTRPELEYWKSYCEMLKEENVQLSIKVNTMENSPTNTHQQRVNDLEQTILTLRGLVAKFQAEQKSSVVHRRVDSGSRPCSGHSGTDKAWEESQDAIEVFRDLSKALDYARIQLEPYRVEIANLKRTILDKDLLLEKSKEMLKIAAEREEDLLREITLLRRRLDDLSKPSRTSLSA